MPPIITLTTDFGLSDAYVGVMKGVILRLAPHAVIVDICHQVPPQDVVAASFLLADAYRYFMEGTIHVAVVDPQVGTSRRPLAILSAGYYFVGPDNGLFSFVLNGVTRNRTRAVHLTDPAYWLPVQSATFHGRDIFAPVAAHLARGVPFESLGMPVPLHQLVKLHLPPAERTGDVISGEVVHVDRFGNLITSIHAESLRNPQGIVVEIARQRIIGLRRTYAEVQVGELLALVSSAGYVEIAVNSGNAAERLQAQKGTPVRITDGISSPRHTFI